MYLDIGVCVCVCVYVSITLLFWTHVYSGHMFTYFCVFSYVLYESKRASCLLHVFMKQIHVHSVSCINLCFFFSFSLPLSLSLPNARVLEYRLKTDALSFYGVVCCSMSQDVAVCCSMLQCVIVCCSAPQCVAVCCSVLQCGDTRIYNIRLVQVKERRAHTVAS